MIADLVADVGNSRIKWGLCQDHAVAGSASLPPDDPAAWRAQLEDWRVDRPFRWAVAGVHPARRERLVAWLRQRDDEVLVLDSPGQLPLRVCVQKPERVGIDRLLNAVAANARRPKGEFAVIVDAGSAVTVDWLDRRGAFRGGAILPGIQLMAQALHDHTALLPLIDVPRRVPEWRGTDTVSAIEAGIYWSVAGGIRALIREPLGRAFRQAPVFLTGGDARLLEPVLSQGLPNPLIPSPLLTLEGIRLSAEALP